MHSDEELIADRNIRTVAEALLDVIKVFEKVAGCENAYIRDLGRELKAKYDEILEDIVNCGNGV